MAKIIKTGFMRIGWYDSPKFFSTVLQTLVKLTFNNQALVRIGGVEIKMEAGLFKH